MKALFFSLLALAFSITLLAQTSVNETYIFPAPSGTIVFGTDMASDEYQVVIAARNDSTGFVQVIDMSTPTNPLVTTLFPNYNNPYFGARVSIWDDEMLVTSSDLLNQTFSDSVHYYQRIDGNWIHKQAIPSLFAGVPNTGRVTGMCDTHILIRADFASSALFCLYRKVNGFWSYQQDLIIPGGYTISNEYQMNADWAFIAQKIASVNTVGGAGRVAVFKRDVTTNNWNFYGHLTAPTAALNQQFGNTIALKGNELWVGDNNGINLYKYTIGSTSISAPQTVNPASGLTGTYRLAIQPNAVIQKFDNTLFANEGMTSYTIENNSYVPNSYFTFSEDATALSKGDLVHCGNYIFTNTGAAQTDNLKVIAYYVSGCADETACNYSPGAAHENITCSYRQPADFDCSMSVDINDIIALIEHFGCIETCSYYDLNGDGFIGVQDLLFAIAQ